MRLIIPVRPMPVRPLSVRCTMFDHGIVMFLAKLTNTRKITENPLTKRESCQNNKH